MSTSDASIFITGAASGIGLATARLFAEKGWRVGLCDRDGGALTRRAGELGALAEAVPLDVRDRAAMERAIATFAGGPGGLSTLFGSAGLLDMRPFIQTPPERLDAILDVNVKGVMNGILAALPYLRRGGAGRIVTMSSAAAVHGVPDLAVYSASKFAVRGLTEALNIELEREGIWVCDIMVGYVDTPMLSTAETTAVSVGINGIHVTPEMVAETVWNAVLGRQVHWFVTEADRKAADFVEATPREARRDVLRSSTGY